MSASFTSGDDQKLPGTPSQQVAAAPALGSERYEFLDVLRGVSLLGIVVANMISYSLYLYVPEETRAILVPRRPTPRSTSSSW